MHSFSFQLVITPCFDSSILLFFLNPLCPVFKIPRSYAICGKLQSFCACYSTLNYRYCIVQLLRFSKRVEIGQFYEVKVFN